jgi:DNA polymerase-3 subunit delta
MAKPSFKEIISGIKAGRFAPIYYLFGEELWHIEAIIDELGKNVLSESEKAFNQMVFYGNETSEHSILDFARRFPVMASYQLLICKNAKILNASDALVEYFKKPVPTTVLVLMSEKGTFDKRTSAYKALSKTGIVFESKKPYDNQVPRWIQDYVEISGARIQPEAGQLLAEYLGTDLKKIANEVDKLLIQMDDGISISRKQVESSIGISREYNVFELQKALSQESADRIIWITDRMSENIKSNPLPLVMGSLYRYFSNIYVLHSLKSRGPDAARVLGINPYFMKEYIAAAQRYSPDRVRYIISLLSEYDLKSKGVGSNTSTTSAGDLLREMIAKILLKQPVSI